MTDKAYIVANKEQELDVLKKLENDGFKWGVIGTLPTKFRFSEAVMFNTFPYVISTHEDEKFIGWSYYSDYHEGNVIYDGRKEEKKYKVTKGFMDALVEWRDEKHIKLDRTDELSFISGDNIKYFPYKVKNWWLNYTSDPFDNNRRLIAIIEWLNGEDVFEVEKPHKFVVRSDKNDRDGDYTYISVENDMTTTAYVLDSATIFDTREEAQEWANSHQVVVEIDAEGNEVVSNG